MEMLIDLANSPRKDRAWSKDLEGKTQLAKGAGFELNGHACQVGRVAPGGRTHLPPGDVHEHRKAGGVAALAGDVGPVPGQQLAALGRPASSPTGAAEKRRG